jgi:hypothetical protein
MNIRGIVTVCVCVCVCVCEKLISGGVICGHYCYRPELLSEEGPYYQLRLISFRLLVNAVQVKSAKCRAAWGKMKLWRK